MPPTSAAMELKVLINILTQGTAVKSLLSQINDLSKGLTNLQAKASGSPIPPSITPKAKEAETAVLKLTDAFNKLHSTVRLAAGGFLAFESVRFIKGLADAAARAEVLQTVMHQVGSNAGISVAKLNEMDRAVQKLGITASASRESITRAIQADIPLDAIQKLARGAQDTAVILGTDSSTAFDRMVTAVQTQNTMVLRNMGIVLQAEAAYSRYAQTIGKSAGQLTAYQRTMAFTNAVLQQLTKLEGTYEAAMGDTGKQLTTLTRLTQTLKENLGVALLPAYSALVVELTDVLKYLGLVSEGMTYQTKASRELGESVKNVASVVGDLVKALADHAQLVMAAVEGYFIFKTVKFLLTDIVGLFLRFAVGLEASAIAGTGLVAALGGWATIIIAVIAGIALLVVQFPRFREGVYAAGNAIWALVKFIRLLIEGWARLGVVFDQMIDNLYHPFTADWKKPWTEWSDWIKTTFKDVSDSADEAKKHWEKALTPPKPEEIAEKDIREANLHLIELAEKRVGLAEQLEAAQKKLVGKPKGSYLVEAQEEVRLAEELKKLDADREATVKKRFDAYDKAGYNPKQRVEDQLKLEDALIARQARLAMQGVDKAREGAPFTYTETGEEKSRGFDTQITQYNTLLDNYIKKTKDANIPTEELRRSLVDAGKAAKTAHDIQDMATAVNSLRAAREEEQKAGVKGGITASQVADAEDALRTARLEKQRADIAETSEIFQQRQTLRQQDQQRQTDYLSFQLNQLQTAHERLQAADDYAFERGRLSVDEYYKRKEDRIRAAGKVEAALAEKALVTAQLMPGRDEAERSTRATAIAAAQQAQVQKGAELENKIDQNNQDRTEARVKLDKQILDLRLETSAAAGSEAAALQQVDEKYEEMSRTLKAAADSEGLAADSEQRLAAQAEIANALFQERNKLQEEFNQKHRDAVMAAEADGRRELDLAKTRRDTQRAIIARRVEEGSMTEAAARQYRNALTRTDIDDAQLRLDSLRRDRERIQERQTNAPDERRKQLEAESKAEQAQGRLGLATEEINRQVEELQRTLHAAAVSTEAEMEGVTTSIQNMMASIESYSKEVQAQFIDGFADAMTQSIIHFRDAGKIWVSLSEQIGTAMLSAFTKAFTDRLFKNLGLFRFMDIGMNWLFGGGGGGYTGNQYMQPAVVQVAEGGLISGPGTGTSDSVPAMLSAGEHVMPAAKAAQFMPLLEGIRLGRVSAYAMGGMVALQSIATPSIIPRRYANGGVVVADGGASAVQMSGGTGNMVVTLDPGAMNMTLREWLEREVVRQQGRR